LENDEGKKFLYLQKLFGVNILINAYDFNKAFLDGFDAFCKNYSLAAIFQQKIETSQKRYLPYESYIMLEKNKQNYIAHIKTIQMSQADHYEFSKLNEKAIKGKLNNILSCQVELLSSPLTEALEVNIINIHFVYEFEFRMDENNVEFNIGQFNFGYEYPKGSKLEQLDIDLLKDKQDLISNYRRTILKGSTKDKNDLIYLE
jgi:hypothetical protein